MIADENRRTRARHSHHYFLHTPDAFVRSPLPSLRNAMAVIHVTPSAGAQFTQYTVEFQQGGLLEFNAAQHFLYVLEGEVDVEEHLLRIGDYAYIPAGGGTRALTRLRARALVIERPFVHSTVNRQTPKFFVGNESSIEATPMCGDVFVLSRTLIPKSQTLGFTINTITYRPGATLARVEMHPAERSILILSGGGISRFGDDWNRVSVGDFMWMGAGCPQWFGALGNNPTTYLIYHHAAYL